MLFNSVDFLFVFLPITLVGVLLLGRLSRTGAVVAWLAAASLLFYGWDDPGRLLPIILVSIVGNYGVGALILRRRSRPLLVAGIVGNLMLLGWYKYAGFAIENVDALTGWALPRPEIALPIGISFFTFTQIAFLVDAYRGEARAYDPLVYALFVSFFPHLIAGPILRQREVMPQLAARET